MKPSISERGIGQGWARFLYGGSTGGWIAPEVDILVGGQRYTPRQLLKPFRNVRTSGRDAVLPGPAPARSVRGRVPVSAGSRFWWHDPEVVAEQYAHACDAYEALLHQGREGH